MCLILSAGGVELKCQTEYILWSYKVWRNHMGLCPLETLGMNLVYGKDIFLINFPVIIG